jgi:hypothetical protein
MWRSAAWRFPTNETGFTCAPHPEERALARVSKDGPRANISWFETALKKRLLTMRVNMQIYAIKKKGPRERAFESRRSKAPK